MEVKDKVIAITGGAQGLGLAMAQNLANGGAKLALVDLNPERLNSAKSICQEAGSPQVETYETNITDEAAVEGLFASIIKDFGALNGLVNNAGILRDGLLLKVKDGQVVSKMGLDQWNAVIDTNLTGVFLCGREAALQMVTHQCEGVIVNISSVSQAGNLGQTNYSAAKAGVSAMTVLWARELAKHNIRVAGIAPGFIATEMVASMKPEALERMAQGIPLKRLGKPEDIAKTTRFIFDNDYVTGRVIEVDGGFRM